MNYVELFSTVVSITGVFVAINAIYRLLRAYVRRYGFEPREVHDFDYYYELRREIDLLTVKADKVRDWLYTYEHDLLLGIKVHRYYISLMDKANYCHWKLKNT